MNIHGLITLLLVVISTVLQALWLDNAWMILLAGLGLMSIAWGISVPLKDVSIIDIFWGLSFMVGSVAALLLFSDFTRMVDLILLAMVSAWGLRLSLHIWMRSLGHDEDSRYAEMRAEGGERFWIKSLPRIFYLQAWMSWGIMAPLTAQYLSAHDNVLTPVAWAGLGLWLFGFLYESIADWQLTRFKKNPDNQGKLLTTGLWRYCRHPNYFGETLLWWGLYLYTVPYGGAWFVIGPIIITYSLLKFSGVTMLESGMKKRREGYEDYMRNTPSFLPSWIPGIG